MITQKEIDRVCEFESKLSKNDEWLFFHLAWGRSTGKCVTWEDKYAVMLNWDELTKEDEN